MDRVGCTPRDLATFDPFQGQLVKLGFGRGRRNRHSALMSALFVERCLTHQVLSVMLSRIDRVNSVIPGINLYFLSQYSIRPMEGVDTCDTSVQYYNL